VIERVKRGESDELRTEGLRRLRSPDEPGEGP
jgi:hypothetical protein